jgi:hypothetical protein
MFPTDLHHEMMNEDEKEKVRVHIAKINRGDTLDRDISLLLSEDENLTSSDIAYILDQPLGRIQPRVARIQSQNQNQNQRDGNGDNFFITGHMPGSGAGLAIMT